jgi:hypothetical protein
MSQGGIHALLPIKKKEGSDWGYSWVPMTHYWLCLGGPFVWNFVLGMTPLLFGSNSDDCLYRLFCFHVLGIPLSISLQRSCSADIRQLPY